MLLLKYFYSTSRTLNPQIEKTSVFHPQNKVIKKAKQRLKKYLKQLKRNYSTQVLTVTKYALSGLGNLTHALVSLGTTTYINVTTSRFLQNLATETQSFFKLFIADGAKYFRGLLIVFVADALTIDDEPLWEPIE
jgi:hypothetical protein